MRNILSSTGENKITGRISILLLILLYFILGYDRIHHWDEPYYLYNAAFTNPSEWSIFHMFKYGHLLILKLLVGLTGVGLEGLFIISFSYALMILCFVFCSFLLLKEIIGKEEAKYVALILMFLPVTLYLSFKTLAEVPSILFGVLSLLAFMYTLKFNGMKKLSFILASGFFLFLSILCRFEASIMFISFLFALSIIYGEEYGTKKVYSSFLLVSMVSLALILIALAITNINLYGMITYFFSFQEKTRYTTIENFFMFFLEGGLFFSFTLFSFFDRSKELKFALIWFIGASIVPIFFMDHVEARRLCWNMIPLAMLVFLGMKNVFRRLEEKECQIYIRKILLVFLFVIILVSNQLLIASGPDKIDERAYSKLFGKIEGLYGNRIILVSTSYDYDFIKFAFPSEEILYVEGERNKTEVMKLLEHNETILYLTWNISRDFIIYKYDRSNYDKSWIVQDQRIKLKKIAEEERYSAYLVVRTGAHYI